MISADVFIFQAAGHETTAHAIAFTLGLLALYQDEQQKLFEHIMSIIPDGRIPVRVSEPVTSDCANTPRAMTNSTNSRIALRTWTSARSKRSNLRQGFA